MTHPEPSITLNVDLTNPGQFFACCGLLELADRLWPKEEVVGSFAPPRFERSSFQIHAKKTFRLGDLVKVLLDAPREAVDPYRPIMGSNGKPVADAKKTKPVLIGEPLSLRLSWWLHELAGRQSAFKMWGAHQTSEGLIGSMVENISDDVLEDNTILQSRVGMTGRIGLDTRSSWNALDEGFSPNNQNLPVETYPATELLAAIGLQTFVPMSQENGYVYTCWTAQLPTSVARAAVCGSINLANTARYHFQIGARGKFKYFTKASKLERSTNG